MRITSVSFTGEIAEMAQGLRDVRMGRLGQVVALAGPNGSGKSRLFRELYNLRKECHPRQVASLRTNLQTHLDARAQTERDGKNRGQYDAAIAQLKRKLQLAEAVKLRGGDLDAYESQWPFFTYVPSSSRTGDYRQRKLSEMEQLSASVGNIGFGGVEQHLQPYIYSVFQDYWDTRHPESRASDEHKAAAAQTCEDLNASIEAFLGGRIEHHPGEVLRLFGRPLPECGLSDGQNVLLKLALSIHTQGQKLDGSVLFLDEPETHLHPKAIADFLARLRKLNPNGQIWLATHSLHLLAQCEQDEIWFIEDGVVRWGGKTPERVIRGLTGDDDTAGRLVDFLNWPAQLASSRFAAECLVPPESVWTDEHDDQCQQIRTVIETRQLIRPRVLDWGAGKGRILAALRSVGELDYYAFEPGPDAAALTELVAAHFDDGAKRVFDKESGLDIPGGVDVVVMCNVLHEIPPAEWVRLFADGSALDRALTDEGHLLVVEDHLIPKGEKAHTLGFLVLGKPELRDLFAIPAEAESDGRFTAVEARKGRLGAYLIAKSLLTNVSRDTRAAALKALVARAKARIRELRDESPSYRVGREHGFWTQQFANASLALEEL